MIRTEELRLCRRIIQRDGSGGDGGVKGGGGRSSGVCQDEVKKNELPGKISLESGGAG